MVSPGKIINGKFVPSKNLKESASKVKKQNDDDLRKARKLGLNNPKTLDQRTKIRSRIEKRLSNLNKKFKL